ncbi:MAG TPA: hypothetical protein VMT75_08895 [Candidatus Saccharimonadales bacterium]|nr:hypothetical protein [Candidatus Saccharimonadales bacterium]
MTSRKALSLVGILVWAGVALTAAPRGIPRHYAAAATVTTAHSNDIVESCNDLHIRFDHHDTVMQSEVRTVTKSEAPTLRVRAEYNGGLQVQGWDQAAYSVTLCKAAEAGSGAESLLSQIHLTFQNSELGVSGPSSGDHWSAYLLIRAPKAAAMDLQAHNGPLTLRKVDGSLRVRAENGPVTVTDCNGDLDLASHNGPVTLEGNSGKLKVTTENGPVTVALTGAKWNGSGLDAHATNGPVRLEIPSGYQSGVVLESDGNGPFQCRASVCSEGRKTWDEDHKRVEFGSGPTLVRVSTVNGPVSVN